jgi:DNA-binding NtrC family response regulator
MVRLAIMGDFKSNNGERSRPRVFVVDDEPILLELAEKVLSSLKCEIHTFTNPEIALREYMASEKPPEVLITDFAMHEMNGLALIRACRRLHPNQKIILISGTVDEAVFNNTGVKPNKFLAKPYLAADLTNTVAELLKG